MNYRSYGVRYSLLFCAKVEENSTGVHAFELFVNRYTGAVFSEMDPRHMWNTKYRHMNWNTQAQTSISREEELKYAQVYLDKAIFGATADEADAFYGYYTINVQRWQNLWNAQRK